MSSSLSELSEPFPHAGSTASSGVPAPDEHTRWRCSVCGNLTRFDVERTLRTRDYVHFDLSGEARIDEREVLAVEILQVRCRWCDRVGTVELVPRPDANAQAEPSA